MVLSVAAPSQVLEECYFLFVLLGTLLGRVEDRAVLRNQPMHFWIHDLKVRVRVKTRRVSAEVYEPS